MKTLHIFILSISVIFVTFLGIISEFYVPEALVGWVVTDILLIIYISYLLFTFLRRGPDNKAEHGTSIRR